MLKALNDFIGSVYVHYRVIICVWRFCCGHWFIFRNERLCVIVSVIAHGNEGDEETEKFIQQAREELVLRRREGTSAHY